MLRIMLLTKDKPLVFTFQPSKYSQKLVRRPEADFKEFEPRLKYSWFHVYSIFQDLSQRPIATGFCGSNSLNSDTVLLNDKRNVLVLGGEPYQLEIRLNNSVQSSLNLMLLYGKVVKQDSIDQVFISFLLLIVFYTESTRKL